MTSGTCVQCIRSLWRDRRWSRTDSLWDWKEITWWKGSFPSF